MDRVDASAVRDLQAWQGCGIILVKMSLDAILSSSELRSVVEDYRSMCFWNMAEDFMPQNREQVLVALDCLERYGTLDSYRRAEVIRSWL